MHDIARSRKFDKEYQKLGGLSAELIDVVYHLLHAIPLPEKYRDHALTGNWKGYRDCHIKPDLVLIYRITDDTLELHRLNIVNYLAKLPSFYHAKSTSLFNS